MVRVYRAYSFLLTYNFPFFDVSRIVDFYSGSWIGFCTNCRIFDLILCRRFSIIRQVRLFLGSSSKLSFLDSINNGVNDNVYPRSSEKKEKRTRLLDFLFCSIFSTSRFTMEITLFALVIVS